MNNLNLENFVSGSIFKFGVDGTILNESSSEGAEELGHTFLIIFNSSQNKIIAASKKLIQGDILLEAPNDKNGAVITINAIDDKYTKNYLQEGENFIADGFALIRAKGVEETIGQESETVIFPDLSDDSNYTIMIKGKLSNNPVFSQGTSFQFNLSTITFGVTEINGN